MKNQYFGDEHDYRKYGLLRILVGEAKVGVCWMLTPSDGRTDGQMLRYLEQPDKWRHFDPELFDHLYEHVVVKEVRSVQALEDAGVLHSASFYPRLLEDAAPKRLEYFAELSDNFQDVDLVFFDPDNGFETTSIPPGRKNSNKYLYWYEFTETYKAGHSVLVYQHFPRKPRTEFIQQIAGRMQVETSAPTIYAFRTTGVVFLLAPQPKHMAYFSRQANLVPTAWAGQIYTSQPLKD